MTLSKLLENFALHFSILYKDIFPFKKEFITSVEVWDIRNSFITRQVKN